jgi:hypothetical protein
MTDSRQSTAWVGTALVLTVLAIVLSSKPASAAILFQLHHVNLSANCSAGS